jgi:hypothetical protein
MSALERWQQDQERMAQQIVAQMHGALQDDTQFRQWLAQQPADGEFLGNPVEDFLSDVTGFCWEVGCVVVRLYLTQANRMVQMETPAWVMHFLDAVGMCHLGIESLTAADCLAVFAEQREEARDGQESLGQ